MRIAALILVLPLLTLGCDGENRLRADAGGDTPTDDGVNPDFGSDGGPEPEPDADMDAEVDPADLGDDPDVGVMDAAIEDFALPDFGPPMDEECNGEDDDLDGLIDEEVSNICGGCGGLPPEGCQVWRINLIQDPDATLLAFRTVGLQAQVQVSTTREIDGALCDVLRLAEAPGPDAHLGVVNVDASQADLNLVPRFDAARGGFAYDNSPELGRTPLHLGDEIVEIRAGGGLLVGPFDTTVGTPPIFDGADDDSLGPIAAAARAEGDGPLELSWTPAAPDRYTTTRLFVGGSAPVFGATRLYRGIEFYQLDARLRDDGELTLDPGVFAGGLANSSVWVYAMREAVRRVPVGQHAVEVVAGQRTELRVSGAGEPPEGAEPPFAIIAPDPNDPQYVVGEPLSIQWSPLPPGEGPLEVALSYRDPVAGEVVQIDCAVDDPAAGELILPPEFTEGLPEDDFAQINMRWGLSSVALPAPDRGTFTRAVSMLLRLDR